MICCKKKPKPESRTILVRELSGLIDNQHMEHFCSNAIISSRYTWLNFFPKNLFEQFHNLANVFFTVIAVMYMFADSSTSIWANLGPLIAILFITMCKDGVEDILRHRRDRKINKATYQVLQVDHLDNRIYWLTKEAMKISVGDIVFCERNRTFPCDLVVLASSDSTTQLNVTTMNLDGESNLKKYFSVPKTQQAYHAYSPDKLNQTNSAEFLKKSVQELYVSINCQNPTADLTKFEGRLSTTLDSNVPLKFENLVLRGAKLCNTDYIIGIAVYTGKDTKLSLNGKQSQRKYSSRESRSNVILLCFILTMVSLALIFTIVFTVLTSRRNAVMWYIPVSNLTSWQFVQNLFRFIFFLNYLIPISIIITIEFQQLLIAALISQDLGMYSEEDDLCAKANNSQLADELGQVEFLFSDKTGTLTQNLMNLRQCALLENDRVYRFLPENSAVELSDESLNRDKVANYCNPDSSAEFLQYLIVSCLCHTVDVAIDDHSSQEKHTPDLTNPNCKYPYEASSPDEKALVEAAAQVGVHFAGTHPAENGTSAKIYTIEYWRRDESGSERLTSQQEYQVDAILEFDSTRKRMTVMVKYPDGSYHIHSKGAETSILAPEVSSPHSGHAQTLAIKHVTDFALQGLRTLVFASRQVTEEQYQTLLKSLDDAVGTLGAGRELAMKQAYACIESDLTPVYVTGVKDELQPGVKRCLQELKAAGIQVWVLTGDKEETAIAVSQAAGHFAQPMSLIRLTNCADFEEAACCLFQQLDGLQTRVRERGKCVCALEQNGSRISITATELGEAVYTAAEKELVNGTPKLSESEIASKIQRFRERLSTFIGKDRNNASRIHRRKRRKRPGQAGESIGLVVDGKTLCFLLDPTLREAFLDLCMNVTTVLCCRMTPLQKASVVQLVQVGLTAGGQSSPVTAAVGDGGNDVAMLLQANIGVGIYGKEGLEAARAADYSLPCFSHLSRLFLLHGHWAYHRLSYTMNLFYYKCTALVTTQVLFNFHNGFSQMVSYNSLLFALYNLTMTSLTCLFYGMYERNLPEKHLVNRPYLYRKITRQGNLRPWYILLWVLDGIWLGLVAFYTTYFGLLGGPAYSPAVLYDQGFAGRGVYELSAVGTATYVVVWIAVNARIAIWSRDLNFMIAIGFFVTLCNTAFFYPIDKILFVNLALSPAFWFTFVLAVSLACFPGLLWRVASDTWWNVQIILSEVSECKLRKRYMRDPKIWLHALCHGWDLKDREEESADICLSALEPATTVAVRSTSDQI